MASSISLRLTNLILSPSFSAWQTPPLPPLPFQSQTVVVFVFSLSDSGGSIRDHAESLLYTIADAAVSGTTTKQNNDWFTGIANYMETILKVLKDGLSTVHLPYSYGSLSFYSPFLLRLLRSLDETKKQGLFNGRLFSGFLLLSVQQLLLQDREGHPPLGWSESDTLAYLVLPLLLIFSQHLSIQIMQSLQPQSDHPAMKTSQAVTKFLPLMIGYFALSVPSGLSLYCFPLACLLTFEESAQQVWLQKYGGAKNQMEKLTNLVMKEDKTQNVEKKKRGRKLKQLCQIKIKTAHRSKRGNLIQQTIKKPNFQQWKKQLMALLL
ncbi:hypothetical protein Rs2_21465 [Raphanus sativus]|nr:hypothetical protein Rs2_21465 [Raphanus sativus]